MEYTIKTTEDQEAALADLGKSAQEFFDMKLAPSVSEIRKVKAEAVYVVVQADEKLRSIVETKMLEVSSILEA